MTDIKIDYIIPTYYNSSIVKDGLDKLCKQTMRECLNVIIVNDCSPNTDCNYQDIIDEYNDKLNITVVTTPYNSGPGMAMQYGVDAGKSDYYLIQDDDDCIASDDVIESYIKIIEAHREENNIATIMGNAALCDAQYNVLNIFRANNKPIVHGRLFYRNFMEKYNIRYNDNVSWWIDDYYINNCISFIMNIHGYRNIDIDKTCYMYRAGIPGSVTYDMKQSQMLFRDVAVEIETQKFIEKFGCTYGSDEAICNKLFEVMFYIIIHYKNGDAREREWNILQEYRKYILDRIDNINSLEYSKESSALDMFNISNENIRDMFYLYLDDSEKNIFNSKFNELKQLLEV